MPSPEQDTIAAPRRDGFAVAEFAHVESAHGVRVRVSDGVHETSIVPGTDDGVAARGMSITSSPDGRSLLVAHEVLQDLWVQRADCVSPSPSR